ncbi:DUF3558 family protein [Corynebacterium vitaeruminis]|uniref:DUF3558 family protein n=1 Tax=Corynebacterium vitaeruminis TaxID=38305 RepID=UPI0009DCE84E|nr:DUF3558 family protein [Corynebacterium vitaeruminis]
MTYKSTHPPGAKTILLVLGLLLGPLVAACSGGTAATAEGDSTPATTNTPSFAPVDFDKDAPDFKFFDACNALSTEDFAQNELKPAKGQIYDPAKPFSACEFDRTGEEMTEAAIGVISDISTQEMVVTKTEGIPTSFERRTPGVYFHSTDGTADGHSCMASVSTKGGRLGVFAFTVTKHPYTAEELCRLSDQILQGLVGKAEQKS